jgi:hypothetical protein
MFGFFKRKKNKEGKFSQPLSPEADKFLEAALKEFGEKEETLEKDWRVDACSEFALDDETGLFSIKLEDGATWEADAQILGSFNTEDETWEWAWGNPHVADVWSRDAKIVRDTGKRLGIWYLHELPMHPLPGPEFLAYLCAIGVKASGSAGMFEAPHDSLVIFIMLKNLRWTKGEAHASTAAAAKTREGESLTDGIRKIKAGAEDILPVWLKHFAKSEVYVLSIDKENPTKLMVLGPKEAKNLIAVFTDKTLLEKAVGDRKDVLFPKATKGIKLLKHARDTKRGLIFNPTDPSATVPLPPEMMAVCLEGIGESPI